VQQLPETGNMPGSKKRLGYWLSQKKCKKLSLSDIEEAFRERNIEPVKIDIDRSLSEQGPFHGILHKLTDYIAKAELGDEEAQQLLRRFETYVNDCPNMSVMDPIDNLRTLINRYKTYSIIDKCQLFKRETAIFIPPFVELNTDDYDGNIQLLRLSKVKFPAVCKPVVAHGSSSAHQMTLIFNEAGLKEVVYPCVVQTFVNHNGVLYKLFALGRKYTTVLRPSIKNFNNCEEMAPIHFDGGEISKPNSSSQLSVQIADSNSLQNGHTGYTDGPPSSKMLDLIVQAISDCMGLGLFGVDVIVEASTGKIAVLDVNAFPGYEGVADFPTRLAEFVREELDHCSTKKSTDTTGACENTTHIGVAVVSDCESKSRNSQRLIQKTSMA